MKKSEPVKKQGWNEPSNLVTFSTQIHDSVRKSLDDAIVVLVARGIPKQGLITRIVSRGLQLACAEFLKHAETMEYIKNPKPITG